MARPPWWMATPAAASAEDQTNALCDVCRHVNFAWLMAHNLPGTDDQEEGKIRLGSLARVRDSTNCPFCRLVMATIFTNEPGALPDYDQVDCELHTIGNVKRDGAGHVDVWLVDSHGFSVTPSAWSCSIQLAQGDGPREQLYLGRIVRRDWTDLSLVKRWLPLCEQHHAHWPVREEELSGVGQDALPSTFRLVDVQRKCLVPAPPAARYVALSYLWGKAPVFKLLLENRSVLEHHGSFVDPAVDLPGTIKDAIFLVDAMGENYLWIDSLCIIQNDDSDKMSQIPCMGAIYSTAPCPPPPPYSSIPRANHNYRLSGFDGGCCGRRQCWRGSPRHSVCKTNIIPARRECPGAFLNQRDAWGLDGHGRERLEHARLDVSGAQALKAHANVHATPSLLEL